MKNILLVITGPSGVGKGTLVNRLLKSDEFALSISCTTRKPRVGEEHGKAYFFISKEEFLKRVEEGDFLEYDEHFGNFYGTPKSFVEEQLREKTVILEIDVVGALNVKKHYPAAVIVMITPPSREVLFKRLKGRGTEDEAEIKRRLARAEYELGESPKFDYLVENAELEQAEKHLREIINQEKNRD